MTSTIPDSRASSDEAAVGSAPAAAAEEAETGAPRTTGPSDEPKAPRWLPSSPRWLTEYRAAWLSHDAIAGVTLAAYAIPVSLAYATLAGLPPQVGIYGY